MAAALHEYGILVTVMNPLFIKQGGGSIRKVKPIGQTPGKSPNAVLTVGQICGNIHGSNQGTTEVVLTAIRFVYEERSSVANQSPARTVPMAARSGWISS